eukprot:IDg22841t1
MPIPRRQLPGNPEGRRSSRRASIRGRGSEQPRIIVANLPDVDEIPSQITIEKLVELQIDDNFSKEIISALNMRDSVRFRDNPDTGVLERISPDGFTAVISE